MGTIITKYRIGSVAYKTFIINGNREGHKAMKSNIVKKRMVSNREIHNRLMAIIRLYLIYPWQSHEKSKYTK